MVHSVYLSGFGRGLCLGEGMNAVLYCEHSFVESITMHSLSTRNACNLPPQTSPFDYPFKTLFTQSILSHRKNTSNVKYLL
jgi:hypothetical protein